MVLAGLGVGIVVSAQFVRISAAAPKDRIATAVSLFYLAQQIGLMTGTSSSAAVVQSGFRERLQELFPGQDSVRLFAGYIATSFAFTGPNVLKVCATDPQQYKLRILATARHTVNYHLRVQEKLRCYPQ